MDARKIFFIALAAFTLCSCTLKEDLTSYTHRNAYFRNATEIKTGLNSCYSLIRTIHNTAYWQMTECATDLLYLNVSNQYDAVCNISPSRPGCAVTVWWRGYQGISRANAMIVRIDKALAKGGITKEEHASLMAEAVILRSFFCYILTSTFGDVPFYTEEVTEKNRQKIASLPRMSADDTRDFCIDELMHWLLPADKGGLGALPLRRTFDAGTDYRAGAALGLMLAGKLSLWNKRWEDAITCFGELENIYGDLSQYPLTDIPFSRKYTPESIWEIPSTYEPYGLQMVLGVAAWSTPSRSSNDVDIVDGEENLTETISDIYNGIAIPELGKEAHVYSAARPTAYYYQNLLPYSSDDLRSGEYSNGAESPRGSSGNLAWRWSGYSADDAERDPANRTVRWFARPGGKGSGEPWIGNKFWCFGMKNTSDFNNPKVFRYAGALLGLSEAWLMAGDEAKALEYLNMTRRRAGLRGITRAEVGGERELLLEEIRCECARELLGEYTRKFDLVRWGIWYERTTAYTASSNSLLQNIHPYHRYWPIPADQVAYSGGALDNKEYGE